MNDVEVILKKFDYSDPSGVILSSWVWGWMIFIHFTIPTTAWVIMRVNNFDFDLTDV